MMPWAMSTQMKPLSYEGLRLMTTTRKGRNIMFKTMLVEDNFSFRQVVKNNLQDQFPSIDIESVRGKGTIIRASWPIEQLSL
jgi:hypothetical protein